MIGAPVGFVALGLARAMLGYILFAALIVVVKVALRRASFFAYLAEKK